MYRPFIALSLALFSQITSAQADTFRQCVADSGAVMYSAWWCKFCHKQLLEFSPTLTRGDMHDAEKMKAFPFVKDCGGENPLTLTPSCLPSGARGVPFWTVRNNAPADEDGKPYSGGGFDVESIAEFTGCAIPKNR